MSMNKDKNVNSEKYFARIPIIWTINPPEVPTYKSNFAFMTFNIFC